MACLLENKDVMPRGDAPERLEELAEAGVCQGKRESCPWAQWRRRRVKAEVRSGHVVVVMLTGRGLLFCLLGEYRVGREPRGVGRLELRG